MGKLAYQVHNVFANGGPLCDYSAAIPKAGVLSEIVACPGCKRSVVVQDRPFADRVLNALGRFRRPVALLPGDRKLLADAGLITWTGSNWEVIK